AAAFAEVALYVLGDGPGRRLTRPCTTPLYATRCDGSLVGGGDAKEMPLDEARNPVPSMAWQNEDSPPASTGAKMLLRVLGLCPRYRCTFPSAAKRIENQRHFAFDADGVRGQRIR